MTRTPPDVVLRPSSYDVATTVERLRSVIGERGIEVFAVIDHAAGARRVGLELADEVVVVFGAARTGTPLMQENPTIGLELPLRVLVRDSDGGTELAYVDPRSYVERYGISQHEQVTSAMAALLDELTRQAGQG